MDETAEFGGVDLDQIGDVLEKGCVKVPAIGAHVDECGGGKRNVWTVQNEDFLSLPTLLPVGYKRAFLYVSSAK